MNSDGGKVSGELKSEQYAIIFTPKKHERLKTKKSEETAGVLIFLFSMSVSASSRAQSTAQYKKVGIYFIVEDSTVRAEVSKYDQKVVHPSI